MEAHSFCAVNDCVNLMTTLLSSAVMALHFSWFSIASMVLLQHQNLALQQSCSVMLWYHCDMVLFHHWILFQCTLFMNKLFLLFLMLIIQISSWEVPFFVLWFSKTFSYSRKCLRITTAILDTSSYHDKSLNGSIINQCNLHNSDSEQLLTSRGPILLSEAKFCQWFAPPGKKSHLLQ
jgi:hypothetical protein